MRLPVNIIRKSFLNLIQNRVYKLPVCNTFAYTYSTSSNILNNHNGYDFAKKFINSIPQNVKFPKNFDNYYSYVYKSRENGNETATITVFYTPQSNKALSVLGPVVDLATRYPNNNFLIVNADSVPRAAYDADIQHFPVALISFGGDCNRTLVHYDDYYQWSESYEWSDGSFPESCNLGLNFVRKLEDEIKSFSCTYNSKAGTHKYTHGIDTDNLNVKRVTGTDIWWLDIIYLGKDSIYTLYKAIIQGHEIVALGNLYPSNNELDIDSYMYQTIGYNMIPCISECLDIPLYSRKISGKSLNTDSLDYIQDPNDEVEDLYILISEIKNKIDIEGVITGAICSEYQRRRVNNVCQRLLLQAIHPLWMKDQKELLDEMIRSGQHSIIVKTSSMGLDRRHLGKSISDLQEYFIELNNKYGFNICGEGGEYETLTLDSPIYKKRIIINKWNIINTSNDIYAPSILYVPIEWNIINK